MAILTMNNVRFRAGARHVLLTIPVGGRERTLHFDPADAIQVANLLATAAVTLVDRPAPAGLSVADLKLRPYDASGHAHLAVLTAEHGPFVMKLDAAQLLALAAAAQGALELSDTGGSG